MTSAKKRFSYCAGERGRNRVRAYEEAKTGILYLEFYERDSTTGERKRCRVSLGHRDREKAKQKADELAAEFARAEPKTRKPEAVTLRQLFDIYQREVTPGKSFGKQRHDRVCAEMFQRAFGAERKARTLNRRDWDRFIRGRRIGDIRPANKNSSESVGDRQIAYDLKWLLAVLNWAVTARDDDGEPFLKRNPLAGLPLPKEESPTRPVVSDERYEAMLAVASDIDWRFKVALVLAHETGHRIKSIRELRWSDVDLDAGRIRWRGDTDKMGYEHETPLTEAAVRALRAARRANPGIGDVWVLPAPEDAEKHCSRHVLRDWWLRAEEKAELPHIKGLGWHGLRRKFATELKEIPLKDLCALGGWKDPQTILKCYQKADEETMRAALRQRSRGKSGALG